MCHTICVTRMLQTGAGAISLHVAWSSLRMCHMLCMVSLEVRSSSRLLKWVPRQQAPLLPGCIHFNLYKQTSIENNLPLLYHLTVQDATTFVYFLPTVASNVTLLVSHNPKPSSKSRSYIFYHPIWTKVKQIFGCNEVLIMLPNQTIANSNQSYTQ